MGLAGRKVGDLAGLVVVWRYDLDRFDGEGLGSVLGKHGDQDVVYYLGFRFVGGCYVYKDVAGFEADLGVVGIDYWGHGADRSVCVENDRVDGGVSNYVEIS